MKDNSEMKGRFKIENITTGEVRETPNTIVSLGKSMMAGLVAADINVGSAFDWIALGIGSSTITANDILLGSEYIKYGLGSVTGTRTTTTVTNDTATFIGSFGIDATKIINEAGLFNQSGLDTGSMMARTTFTDISAGSGDKLNTTWNITFS